MSTISRSYPFLDRLDLPPVVNACGIYTDLGGSRLSPAAWQAAEEMNSTWASMPDLLDRSGELVAELLGAEAARVVPGASAALALSVGACIAGQDHGLIESLPSTNGVAREMILQRAHDYKYVRCALMSGARLREVGDDHGTTTVELQRALSPETAAVLHPAHLDAVDRTVPLEQVSRAAQAHGIPVVVDAAYLSYPVDLISNFTNAGADLACFSAKYFWGPNTGGFIVGRKDLIDAVAALDFTRFEAGPHLAFGRAFKMDRLLVATTVVALEEWLQMDHRSRWADYKARAEELIGSLPDLPAELRTCCFTLDERVVASPVNSVLVTPEHGAPSPDQLAERLAAGRPSIRAVSTSRGLVFCLETVEVADDALLAERLKAAFRA